MYKVQTKLNSNDILLEKFLNKLDNEGYDIITIHIKLRMANQFNAIIIAKKKEIKEYLGPG